MRPLLHLMLYNIISGQNFESSSYLNQRALVKTPVIFQQGFPGEILLASGNSFDLVD